MINRKAEEKIKDWINNSNKALLVSGARQVGKTFSIRRCLKELGCNYLEINLIEQPELIPVMEHSMSVDDLIINLKTGYDIKKVFLHYGDPFINGILGSESRWKGKKEEIKAAAATADRPAPRLITFASR